jgi:hypothetical protein
MTAQESFDNYRLMLESVMKVAPEYEVPGLRAALEMANAAAKDIDEDD